MGALIVDDAAPQRLRHSHIPSPAPTAHEALIETSAVSVNPTDLALLDAAPNRTVLGYEFSGIVLQPALDGTGPPAGARVAGMVMGGVWAQRVAVPSAQLAVVPEGIDLQSAATVPIAGVSALRALHAGGAILGRRVLVTGATGAVGACAVQLASVGGAAAIVAVARSQEYSDRLRALGATRVVTNPREGGELADTVIDTVGGDLLPDAFAMTAAGGDLISVGRASGDDIVLPAQALEGAGGRSGRTIHTFFMPDESGDYGSDLRFILDLVSSGRLDVGVDHVEELCGDLSLLRSGTWAGKLVLTTH